MIASLGLTGCDEPLVEYGVPVEKYGCPPPDTLIHCMYGVPAPEYGASEFIPDSTDDNTTNNE